MKPQGVIFVVVAGFALLAAIYALLRARLLSIGLAAWWMALTAGVLLGVTVTPFRIVWFSISQTLFQSSPFVIAFTIVSIVFLLYISVVISVLQRQVREITQTLALRPGDDDDPLLPGPGQGS